jgi:hypothetical protein
VWIEGVSAPNRLKLRRVQPEGFPSFFIIMFK